MLKLIISSNFHYSHLRISFYKGEHIDWGITLFAKIHTATKKHICAKNRSQNNLFTIKAQKNTHHYGGEIGSSFYKE